MTRVFAGQNLGAKLGFNRLNILGTGVAGRLVKASLLRYLVELILELLIRVANLLQGLAQLLIGTL